MRSCLCRPIGAGEAAVTAGCAGPQSYGSRTATAEGCARFVRPAGGRRNRRITAVRMRAKLTIGAVAAGLALTACGSAGGPASGAHRDHAGATSPQHVQQAVLTGSDVKDLARLKREYAGCLAESRRNSPAQVSAPRPACASRRQRGSTETTARGGSARHESHLRPGSRPCISTNTFRRLSKTMHSGQASGTACSWRRGGPDGRAAPARVPPPRYGAWPGCCFAGRPRKTADRVLAGREAAASEPVALGARRGGAFGSALSGALELGRASGVARGRLGVMWVSGGSGHDRVAHLIYLFRQDGPTLG